MCAILDIRTIYAMERLKIAFSLQSIAHVIVVFSNGQCKRRGPSLVYLMTSESRFHLQQGLLCALLYPWNESHRTKFTSQRVS
jgi:hypothetical protein